MASVRKQIVAMGGDSFSAEPEGSRLDAYVLASTGSCGEGRERGVILTGVSACPHYDGETDRRPTYHRLIRAGFPAGYAADDGAALHFADRRLEVCVASRPTAGVYGVGADGETLTETALPVWLLG